MKLATVGAVLLFSGLSSLAGQADDTNFAPSTADLRAHYLAVIDELRAADVSGLTATQCASRAAMIDELAAYAARADFGYDPTPDDRQNLFRDADGRLCAVGNLLRATGQDALVDRIARERNGAFVLELADEPGLAAWLASVGLTAEEAARVQGPGLGMPKPPAAPTPSNGAVGGPSAKARSSSGLPAASHAPSMPAGASAAAADRARRGAATQGYDPGADPVTGGVEMEDWWMWWEMNKAAFLPPRRLSGPVTESGGALPADRTLPDLARQRALAQLLPEVRQQLADGDAGVRAAAAIALGRLGGDAAVPDLLPLLSDSDVLVRESAILALGATGSMVGAHALLSLAQTGTVDGADSGSHGPVCASARPLAILALGVARRRGLDATVDDFVAPLLDERGDDARDVREATLLGLDLARSPLAAALATHALAQKDGDSQLSCRALEALGDTADPAHVPLLLDRTGARDLEQRRAAAAALACSADPLLAAALRTAVEVEKEPFARGLLLVTLGEQGGAANRDFLGKVATRGSSANRPWAALGLGLLARRDHDEAARAILRDALSGAGESQGAWILACGLAQDEQAGPELAKLLEASRNPRVRMFAALSLAMCNAPDAAELLATRLDTESSPLARVGLAQGLGVLGRPQDAGRLLTELRDVQAPVFAAQYAAALGFHGSHEAVDGLTALVEDAGTPALARAGALDALGLLLDRGEPLLLTEVTRGRNYRTLPDWLAGVLPTTSL